MSWWPSALLSPLQHFLIILGDEGIIYTLLNGGAALISKYRLVSPAPIIDVSPYIDIEYPWLKTEKLRHRL